MEKWCERISSTPVVLSRILSSCDSIWMSTYVVRHVSYTIKSCAINLRACSLIHIGYDGDFSALIFLFLEAGKLNAIYTRGYYLHQNWVPASGTTKGFGTATTPLQFAFQEAEAAVGCSEGLRGILLGKRFLHHSLQCDGSSSILCLWGGLQADVGQAIWLCTVLLP